MDDLAFSALSRRGPRRCRLERQAVLLSSSQSTRSCLSSKSAKLQRDDLSDRWLPYDALIIVSPVQPQLALRRSRKLTSRPRCLYGNWRGLGRASAMNILLYNPDNEVTNNFMPHLWMFLLKSLTPPGHEVLLVDGKAYRMADALRAAGMPVVMGGPHVTEVPGEPLGRDGEARHADAVALGEADQIWPRIVADAANGTLREVYAPVDDNGKEIKPSLSNYPEIPWDQMDLSQFNLLNRVPRLAVRCLSRLGMTWKSFYMIPIESGRGCPYGCEFCTVTGFFGDSIRFRSNDSIVRELLLLKRLQERQQGKIAVFFIDDNFAINRKRTKLLLRDIIAAGAQLPWVAQISMNLLQDEELVSLIAQSGGRWIFMGLESIDPENLKSVSKNFNKPA